MNANELAGLMELAPTYIQYCEEAATMLRQQQAEIESLKDKLLLTKQSLEILEGWIKR